MIIDRPKATSERRAEGEAAFRDALAEAMAIPDDFRRARVLAVLAPNLSEKLLSGALAAAKAIRTAYDRAQALAALAPYLREAEREIALRDALVAAKAIPDDYSRARSLAELAPNLTERLLPEALVAAKAIRTAYDRARALAALAPYLREAERDMALRDALAAAQAIPLNDVRTRALADLAPQLRDTVLPTAAQATRDDDPARALGEPASHPTETQGESALHDTLTSQPSKATVRPQFFVTRIIGADDEPDVEILTLPAYPSADAINDIEQVEQELFFGGEFRITAGSSVDRSSDACLEALHQVIVDGGIREGLVWKPEHYKAYAQEIFNAIPLPVMNSPLSGSTLLQMVTAAGGGAAFMAAFPNADAAHITLYVLLVGGTRIVLGAADGVSIALKEGLSHILLKWMGASATTASSRKRKKTVLANVEERRRSLRNC
jgi:hypothetical protein